MTTSPEASERAEARAPTGAIDASADITVGTPEIGVPAAEIGAWVAEVGVVGVADAETDAAEIGSPTGNVAEAVVSLRIAALAWAAEIGVAVSDWVVEAAAGTAR